MVDEPETVVVLLIKIRELERQLKVLRFKYYTFLVLMAAFALINLWRH